MARVFVAIVIVCATAGVSSAQTLVLTTSPATAELYRVGPAGNRVPIGRGTAKFKLEKNSPNEVIVMAEGYQSSSWNFSRGEKYPKTVLLALTTRVVKIAAMPYDAQIVVNGTSVGTQSADVAVEEGKSVTVELKKTGFATQAKTYRNQAGSEMPPLTDNLELTDRKVLVTAQPSGSAILADDAQVGETSAELVIGRGKCVTAKIARTGYAPIEKLFCNREQMPDPPVSEAFTLRDRLTAINATPTTASITVNGRQVANGSFQVTTVQGQCTQVLVTLDGYVQQKKSYCNQPNMPQQPPEEHFELSIDEAYTSSVRSDQANVNFTIAVNEYRSPDDAWKLMSQIVLSSFDVLEITDKETGYLRTAWEPFAFKSSTTRTRVIVKLGDTAPLKYVVKIASEYSPEGGTSVKCDECFREWDRVLNKYKDIINEMQSRLK